MAVPICVQRSVSPGPSHRILHVVFIIAEPALGREQCHEPRVAGRQPAVEQPGAAVAAERDNRVLAPSLVRFIGTKEPAGQVPGWPANPDRLLRTRHTPHICGDTSTRVIRRLIVGAATCISDRIWRLASHQEGSRP